MRLSGRAVVVLGAVVGLAIVAATDQIVPASSEVQARMRLWLAARATGITTLLLLWFQVVVGVVLSHPTNQTTWKLSKRLFPWHEDVSVFIGAFVAAHVVSLVLDPYAGVGVAGALVPGLSSYRSSAVALGTLGLYALLVTALTARYARRLPSGAWLRIHRLGLVVFVLGWLHGLLAGTDTLGLRPLYVVLGVLAGGAAAYRYWVTKRSRGTRTARAPASAARSQAAADVASTARADAAVPASAERPRAAILPGAPSRPAVDHLTEVPAR